MTGVVPTELGLLGNDDDEFFDLRNNFFNKTIPTELGMLGQVEAFALDTNSFTGTIPSQIGQLTAAKYFDLQNNKLKGQIPSQIGQFDVRSIIVMSVCGSLFPLPLHTLPLPPFLSLFLITTSPHFENPSENLLLLHHSFSLSTLSSNNFTRTRLQARFQPNWGTSISSTRLPPPLIV